MRKVNLIQQKKAFDEMQVLLWVSGQLVPQMMQSELGHLPESEFFEPSLSLYNRKVAEKITAEELRKKIQSKISYIRRRAQVGKNPWYKNYFLHFFTKNLNGLTFADEPMDYKIAMTPERTPKKQTVAAKRRYRESIDDDFHMEKRARKESLSGEE